MPYFPLIDYSGVERLGQHFQDPWKVDKELEDRAMKKSLYNAQIANYELGAKRYEREERDYQEDREIGKQILGLYNANRSEYSPSITKQEVPDEATANEFYPGGRVESIYTPPKRSLYGDAAQALMGSGKWQQAMKMMEAEDKVKRERTDNLIDAMGKITKAYEIAPSLGKNLHKIFSESFPELKNHDFAVNTDGRVDKEIVTNPVDGKPYGWYEVRNGKRIGGLIKLGDKKNAVDLADAIANLKMARLSGDPEEIKKAELQVAAQKEGLQFGAALADRNKGKEGEKPEYTTPQANKLLTNTQISIAKIKSGGKVTMADVINAPPALQAAMSQMASGKYEKEDIDQMTNAWMAQAEAAFPYASGPIKENWSKFKNTLTKNEKVAAEREDEAITAPAVNFLKSGSPRLGKADREPTQDDINSRVKMLSINGKWSRQSIGKALKRAGFTLEQAKKAFDYAGIPYK